MRKFIAFSSAIMVSGCSYFDSPFTKACEEALSKRLRSPSSYERISINQSEAPISTRMDLLTYLRKNSYPETAVRSNLARFDRGEATPVVFKQVISYDAANAYNAKIRGYAECEYFSISADDEHAAYFSVKIDGKTNSEWLPDSIR